MHLAYSRYVFPILFCLTKFVSLAQSSDTLKVYFDVDSYQLTNKAKQYINAKFSSAAKYDTLRLLINGFTDFTGDNKHNYDLSGKRALSVLEYLNELGIDENNIKLCIGKGEIKRIDSALYNKGIAEDRRAEIIPVGIDLFKRIESNYYPPFDPDTIHIPINETAIGEAFVFEHLYFQSSRHSLVDISRTLLDKLYTEMERNPRLRIRIEGHICCTRVALDEQGNLKKREAIDLDVPEYIMKGEKRKGHRYFRYGLSSSRAKYIYDYLSDRGIDKKRIEYKGFGNTKPLIKDDIFDSRNRRIEIRILGK